MINPKFLSIQGSYSQLEIALFDGLVCFESIKEHNRKASAQLIPHIEYLLKNNGLLFTDLDFICVDQGPGAFTSLRVTISTVNGLAFANKIPLIGIDGLQALSLEVLGKISEETQVSPLALRSELEEQASRRVTLLNAYNDEVFFYIPDSNFDSSYKKIDILLLEIQNKFKNEKILFAGNGAQLHKELIIKIFGQNALLPEDFPTVCSANQIAKMALENWQKMEERKLKLSPLYLKSQNFAIKTAVV